MGYNETATTIEEQIRLHDKPLALSGMPGIAERPAPAPRRLPVLDLPPAKGTPPQDYVRPGYAESFACIGPKCEDNCCTGWSVPIDQATYEKYASVPGIKQHLGTLVVLNTAQQTSADFARIPLSAQSECGFLDGQKMCSIQKEHGSQMLSSTCATYPRAVATNAGAVEKALNLSCPEAARLTLLNPNLLGAGVWKKRGPARYDAVTRQRPDPSLAAHLLDRNALAGWQLGRFEPRLAVREFALLVLGDRRYPLWQRLYLLGNLAWRLQSECQSSGSPSSAEWCEAYPDRVVTLLNESVRTASTQTLRPTMDEIAFEPDQQIQLVLEMLKQRFQEPPVPLRFLECVQDFQLGLGTATAASEQEILAAYSTSYRQYYAPIMERHPHLLENYLTNLAFKNNYPFGKNAVAGRASGPAPSAVSEHLLLCVQVAVAQTLLIGMAGHYREAFDTTHIIKLMQSQARTLEHSPRSTEQILQFVADRKLNNQQGIARLLRTEASAVSKDASLYRSATPGFAANPALRLAASAGAPYDGSMNGDRSRAT